MTGTESSYVVFFFFFVTSLVTAGMILEQTSGTFPHGVMSYIKNPQPEVTGEVFTLLVRDLGVKIITCCYFFFAIPSLFLFYYSGILFMVVVGMPPFITLLI